MSENLTNQNKPKLSLLVAMYNEEESIKPLAKRILPILDQLRQTWSVQLILLDDGSVDATWVEINRHFTELEKSELMILRHPDNAGLGAAMRTGFAEATGDFICTLDCDCTYAPENIPQMLDQLIEAGADISTASPYHPDGEVDAVAWRLFLSKGCSFIYWFILPQKLYCYTSLFRVYRRKWANPGLFSSTRFLAVTEILMNSILHGAKVIEFPTKLENRKFGQSKMSTLQTMLDHLRLMSKMSIARLLPSRLPSPEIVQPKENLAKAENHI